MVSLLLERSHTSGIRSLRCKQQAKLKLACHAQSSISASTPVTLARPRGTLGPEATPIPLILATVTSMLLTAPTALAAEAPELFLNKCAGCHMNGGNVLAGGATLFQEDLQKNGVESGEALYRLIYSGKGKMPGFGKECAPRGACTFGPRLGDEEVAALADYVRQRAAVGWLQQ